MPTVLRAVLSVDYRNNPGILRRVAIDVNEGEIVGLVGQSGSGKTTLTMALLGLLHRNEATITGSCAINGTEMCGLPDRDLRRVRGRLVSLIPQNPVAALNPSLRIGTQFREAWLAHAKDWPGQGICRSRELLESCGLPASDDFLRRYPHEISVGQAQRVLISMALLHDPALLIADEPTSALDLITQREVLDLIGKLRCDRQMSVLFISHDLLVVANLCDRVAILHGGTIVEFGATDEVLLSPRHSYTQRLLNAVPRFSILRETTRNSNSPHTV